MATTIVLKNMTGSPIVLNTLGGLVVAGGGSTLNVVPGYFTEVEFWGLYADEIKGYVDNESLRMVVDGVEYTDAAEGDRWSDPISLQDLSERLFKVANEPTGFPDRTSSILSFTPTLPDRTLSIAPTGASFSFYSAGVKYTKSTAQTVQIDDTEGIWFCYFDTTGTLVASQTPWTIANASTVPVAIVYWDATNKIAILLGDERHGLMDNRVHSYLHQWIGTVYISGLIAGDMNLSGDGSADAHARFTLSSPGVYLDEDITLTVTHADSPSEQFQQCIDHSTGNYCDLPIFYLSGATGAPVWRRLAPQAHHAPVYRGTNRIQRNAISGGNWVLQDVAANGSYSAMWILATNDVDYPIVAVMGQREDTSSGAAATYNTYGSMIFTGLPFQEITPLYCAIYQTSSLYTNASRAALRAMREQKISGANRKPGVVSPPQEYWAEAIAAGAGTTNRVSSNTDPNWVEKVRLTVAPEVSGEYFLEWSVEVTSALASNFPRIMLRKDGNGTTGVLMGGYDTAVGIDASGAYVSQFGMVMVPLIAGVSTYFDFNYSAGTGSTAYVRNARLHLRRMGS